ncbi:hypothetical protein OE88DRAFT_1646208 [Heliocybe sulcata]|uniref:F-box domain-containing protein n=1 Tax=Heliocybe sulcata TaxID=5364 RepID=A0A5C3MY00_9AGAM|nr:hypothetical protein OE88DRAFT_1646208 [Heliocybe sulcata]
MAFAPALLQAMPPDVFENIVVRASEKRRQDHGMKGLLEMTHVSRKVQGIVLKKKELWNRISMETPALAALFLERAARPKVTVSIAKASDKKRVSDRFDVLELYAATIVSLRINIPGKDWEALCTERRPEAWQMGMLESAELRHYDENYELPPAAVVPFQAPILKDLLTFGLPLKAVQPIISGTLRRLQIQGNVEVTTEDIWTALKATPNLENLYLCHTIEDDDTRKNVHLPLLRNLVLPIRNNVAAEVFTHLVLPADASLTLEIICEGYSADKIGGNIGTLAPRINRIANANDYRSCELVHDSTVRTKLVLSPVVAAKYAQAVPSDQTQVIAPTLELILDEYPEHDEGLVYDALAQALLPTLQQLSVLKIEDMRSYNSEGLPPSRHLIGPFPTRLLRTTKRDWSLPTEAWHSVLACSCLRKLELRYVRFRKTFLNGDPDDFVGLLLRSIRHFQSEKSINLTIDHPVNLDEQDIVKMEEAISHIHWTGPLGAENGGQEEEEDIEDVFKEACSEADEEEDAHGLDGEVAVGEADADTNAGGSAVIVSGNQRNDKAENIFDESTSDVEEEESQWRDVKDTEGEGSIAAYISGDDAAMGDREEKSGMV